MVISLSYQGKPYSVDLSTGHDISIPLMHDAPGPKCFYAPAFRVEPVIHGDFIGSVEAGSPVNFKNIFINPHGNGTHTECVGHISKEKYTIHECLTSFHHIARLITATPATILNGDHVITANILKDVINDASLTNTMIIRTIPNDLSKKNRDYSGTNPPYFSGDAIQFLVDSGVEHLITDLPSIDREEDGGALIGHKTFWSYPNGIATNKTITEMVYIDNVIKDGIYLCNIQIASIMSDASPSKIVLFDLNLV
jgi:arylformamidase